jgi:hypothetical protein
VATSIVYNSDCDSLLKVAFEVINKRDSINNLLAMKQDTVNGLKYIINNSITVETLQKSHELYNTSFVNMQNSFSIFLIAIGIFITVLTLINFKYVDNSRNELKELKNRFENLEDKFGKFEEKSNPSIIMENN